VFSFNELITRSQFLTNLILNFSYFEMKLISIQNSGAMEEAELFKDEYLKKSNEINEKIIELESAKSLMQKSKNILLDSTANHEDLDSKIKKVLDYMKENDRVALKAAYRSIFEKILVGKKDN